MELIKKLKKRIINRNVSSDFRELDLYSYLDNISFLISEQLNRTGINLVFDIDKSISRYIIMDTEKLKKVLFMVLNKIIEANLFKDIVVEIRSKSGKLVFSIYEYNLTINKNMLNKLIEDMDREDLKYIPHIKKVYDEKYTVQFQMKFEERKTEEFSFENDIILLSLMGDKIFSVYFRNFIEELECEADELINITELRELTSNLEKISKYNYIIISDEYFDELNWDIFSNIQEDYLLREKVIVLNFDAQKLQAIKSFKLNYIEANPFSKYNLYNNIMMYHKKVNDRMEERKNKRVLIVEDNEVNAEVFTEYLKLCYLKGEVAYTGGEALQKLKESHFDLIFTDIQLPDIDGFEIARQIRAENKFIPIIAVTIQLYSGYEEDYSNAGIDDYIAKPVIFEDLQKMLFKYLNLGSVDFDLVKREYGDKIFEVLVKNHLKFIDQYMAEFKKTLEDGDIEAIKKSAHKMKGSISNFKMNKMLRLLNELIYSEIELSEMLKMADLITKEVENLNKELREFVSEANIDLT